MRARNRRKHLTRASARMRCLHAAGALLLAGALTATADAEIERFRFGRHTGYDRIVLDLERPEVAAYLTSNRLTLLVEAEAPALNRATRRRLSDLGVRIEVLEGGFLLIPDSSRFWTTFRLDGGRPRIVIDVGAGAPALPADGVAVPLRPTDAIAGDEPAPVAARPGPPAGMRTRGAASGTRTQGAAPADPRRTDRGSSPQRRERAETMPPGFARFRVRIREISFAGARETGSSRDSLLALELPVRLAPSGDWEAAEEGPGARVVTLREIASSASEAPGLRASVLQQIVERVARFYLEQGRIGTCVEIRARDLAPLLDARGTLVVRITSVCEPSVAAYP